MIIEESYTGTGYFVIRCGSGNPFMLARILTHDGKYWGSLYVDPMEPRWVNLIAHVPRMDKPLNIHVMLDDLKEQLDILTQLTGPVF